MNGTAAGVGLNDRLVRIFGSSASLRDALVLLAAAALTIVLEMFVDLLPTLAGWSRQHPAWQIDTLFTLVFVLAIGFFAFAFRRMREIGVVASRRSEAEGRFRDFAAMADEWFWEMDDQLRLSVVDDQAPPPLVALAQAACALATARRVATMPGRGTGPSSPAGSRFAAFASRSPDDAGSVHHIQISGRPFFDRDGSFCGYRGTGTDVTAVVTAEAASAHLARFDPLTDLPNRTQPLRRGRSRRCAGPRPRPAGRRCCASTSTAFARSTTRLGPRIGDLLLKACARAPRGVHRCWRPRSPASAATSSRSCSTAGAAGRRRRASRRVLSELRRAVRDRRPGGDRWRQRRRRADPGDGGRATSHQARRHRAAPRQGRGPAPASACSSRSMEAPLRQRTRARVRPLARPRRGRVRAPSTSRRSTPRPGGGRARGAAALAAPRAGLLHAEDFLPSRRGDRPDPAARRLGPARGLRAAPRAGRGSASSVNLSPAQFRHRDLLDLVRQALAARPASSPNASSSRSPRARCCATPRPPARSSTGSSDLGVRGRDRRLRHRLFEPELPPEVRQDQDRALVHRRAGRSDGRAGDGPCASEASAGARHGGLRRGRRDRRAERLAAAPRAAPSCRASTSAAPLEAARARGAAAAAPPTNPQPTAGSDGAAV